MIDYKIKKIILFIIFFKISYLNFHNFHKYGNKICICTIGKKENLYAREYVTYYKNLGINKIFIYDNNDINDEKFDLILKDYINENFVEIIDFRGRIGPQVESMEDCRKKNFKHFDWLIFFDMDEYLFLRNYTNINKFLEQKIFQKCQRIELCTYRQ